MKSESFKVQTVQLAPNLKFIARITLIGILFAVIYFILFANSISLSWLNEYIHTFRAYAHYNFAATVIIFFVIRFIFAVISIPGSGVLTILAGAIFDFVLATILVTTSVSLGILVIFLLSRYALQDMVKEKFEHYYYKFERISSKHGASLLFFARVSELVPSFVINSLFAITTMKVKTFFWVSVLGLLPGILIFINAGNQLSAINQLSDLMSWEILLSLAALGLIPLISSILNRCNN